MQPLQFLSEETVYTKSGGKKSKKQLESCGSLGTAQPRAAPDVCDSHRLSKILILIDLNATSAVISENSVHDKIEMSLK